MPADLLNVAAKTLENGKFGSSHKAALIVVEKAPTIEVSTSSGKNQPGTPPHDVIEEMAESIVTTMHAHKNETSSNPVMAKRSILPQLSSEENKKKGNRRT
ncbi:hypothetical protein Tco_1462542 [Tanacetum coccineum]